MHIIMILVHSSKAKEQSIMVYERQESDALQSFLKTVVKPMLEVKKVIDGMLYRGDLEIDEVDVKLDQENYKLSTRFVPRDIQDEIYRTIDTQYVLNYILDSTNYGVVMYCSGSKRGRDKTKLWSKMCEMLAATVYLSAATKCALEGKSVIIHVFDIDRNKFFPRSGETFSPEHVNSAYTVPCRYVDKDDQKLEVTLFRKEERLKVLFHELMHLYSFDLPDKDENRIDSSLRELFGISCRFRLSEAYCEYWARTLWVGWVSGGRLSTFKREMAAEKQWSVRQAVTVIEKMGIEDNVFGFESQREGLIRVRMPMRRCNESTSAFSYYVICGLLMTDWEKTMNWCYRHNTWGLRFDGTKRNIDAFVEYIGELWNDADLLYDWDEQYDVVIRRLRSSQLQTARMTKMRTMPN